jgi:hypothetical protein
MRRHPLQWLWLVVGLSLLPLGALLKKDLRENQIHDPSSPFAGEDVPPELGIAMAMGVFRSVLLDMIWLRANELQQDRRYLEIVQLYDLIGKLQPHNPKVWRYIGWNMSYNISVAYPPGEDRWRWVRNGLKKLLLDGIRYNPHSIPIYEEIAWTFGHKMGRNLDDAHLIYKLRLCESIQGIMGLDAPKAHEVNEWLNGEDANLISRAKQIQSSLKNTWGLDLQEMALLEKDERFGPFDWRLPENHAIYWAWKGLNHNKFKQPEINLHRQIYHSQMQLVRKGSLVVLPSVDGGPPNLNMWPDPRQIEPMLAMFEGQINIFIKENKPIVSLRSAYHSLLMEVFHILALTGEIDEADAILDRAKTYFPNIFPDPNVRSIIAQNMEKQFESMAGDETSSLIASLISRHLWLKGRGEQKKASAHLEQAKELWRLNQNSRQAVERSVNQDFGELFDAVLNDVVKRQLFHPQILKVLEIQFSERLKFKPISPQN